MDTGNGPTRWRIKSGKMESIVLLPDGNRKIVQAEPSWRQGEGGEKYFWGVDPQNNVVKWVKGAGAVVWKLTQSGLRKMGDGPREYIPLRKGIIRGGRRLFPAIQPAGEQLPWARA